MVYLEYEVYVLMVFFQMVNIGSEIFECWLGVRCVISYWIGQVDVVEISVIIVVFLFYCSDCYDVSCYVIERLK